MRKIIISASIAAILAAPTALADPFKGMYAGLGLGWGKLNLKRKDNNLVGSPTDLKPLDKSNLFPINLHAGISSCATNNLYLAGELGLDLMMRNNLKIISPYLAGKIGYRFHERLVAYTGLDINLTYFDLKRGGNSFKKTKFGWGPLGGIAFGLNDKILLGLEYKYRDYGKLHYKVKATGVKSTYEASSHLVLARLSMKLG